MEELKRKANPRFVNLGVSIATSNLSDHVKAVLHRNEILSLGELIQLTAQELRAIPGLGELSFRSITEMLEEQGLILGIRRRIV